MRISQVSCWALALAKCTLSSALDSGKQLPLDAAAGIYDRETTQLLQLHRQLVEIESITGNEEEAGNFVADMLSLHGFTIMKQPVQAADKSSSGKERFNVYAYNGQSPDSKVLVTSHIDTVPPYYNYSIDHKTGKIYGRGAVDAKASVATQIAATLSLLGAGEIRRGDVALLFVVGEEVGGTGMKEANKLGLKWGAGIFGEPTELRLVEGHKGISALNMRAYGKAAHSGYPWLGIDANSKLIQALAKLDKLDLGSSEKFGNTTINIGRIDAGAAGNVVSAYAEAKIQIRVAVGEPAEIQAKVKEACGDEVEYEFYQGYGPVECDSDVDGFEKITVNYGTDVPNLEKERLGKRYLYGPGNIFLAHGANEHLNVKDLQEAVVGYKKLIKHAVRRWPFDSKVSEL